MEGELTLLGQFVCIVIGGLLGLMILTLLHMLLSDLWEYWCG